VSASDQITAALKGDSLTLREIADATGLPWETVRSTVRRHSCFGERYSQHDLGMLYTERAPHRCRVTGRRAPTWALMPMPVVVRALMDHGWRGSLQA